MPPDRNVAAEVESLLAENMLVTVESRDTDLVTAGLLDSLMLVQLLTHLEERFGFKVVMEHLEIDDLRSIHSIAHLVETQRHAAQFGNQKKILTA